MIDTFDPYYQWLGIPPKDQPATHYRLLSLELFESNLDVIANAADRQMAHVRTFQTGPHSAQSQQLLNAIATARICLLNPSKKSAYDATLRGTHAAGTNGHAAHAPAAAAIAAAPAPVAAAAAAVAAPIAPAETESPSAAQPTAGMVIDDYELLECVGHGVMGEVFKARHRRMGRVVAIKILYPRAARHPQMVQRFEREIRAAALLSHPNLVTAYDCRECGDWRYLVMEYVPGQDLGAVLEETGPMPVEQAVECMIQAARGLDYAHSRGVVHRNLKPGNLLLSLDGMVKILDLGLAHMDANIAGDVENLTRTGMQIGTVDYMSPEQAADPRQADARSDIYSLGCTLYRLLTGQVPFPANNLVRKVMAHRQDPIPCLCAARQDVPPGLGAIFQRMLAKRPSDRFQTMGEVLDAFERWHHASQGEAAHDLPGHPHGTACCCHGDVAQEVAARAEQAGPLAPHLDRHGFLDRSPAGATHAPLAAVSPGAASLGMGNPAAVHPMTSGHVPTQVASVKPTPTALPTALPIASPALLPGQMPNPSPLPRGAAAVSTTVSAPVIDTHEHEPGGSHSLAVSKASQRKLGPVALACLLASILLILLVLGLWIW